MTACVKCRQSDGTDATLGLCPRCYGEACSAVECKFEKRKCEACNGSEIVELPVYRRGRLVPDASREVTCPKCTEGEIEVEVCAGKGRPSCAPDGVTCPAREAARVTAEAYARDQVAPI